MQASPVLSGGSECCLSYEEEDTRITYEEEDTCIAYEEEDT
jgi:hypothetical protein